MELEKQSAHTSRRAISRILVAAAVAGFTCILAAEVTLASRKLSATWDEPYNLLAGIRYWQAGDFGINPEHPPLAKLAATLPLLGMRLKVPFLGSNISGPNCNIQGRALVFGNDADAILLRSRLAVAGFALVLIFLLFEAGHRMFGPGVAWLAVVLALFEPNLLAHSALVTADFGLACLYFAGVYALWRVAERPTAWRLIGCGVACGMALAVKHSGIFLIPTLILLVAVEIVWQFSRAALNETQVLARATLHWIARLAIIGALALVVLWGFYRFQYAARPDGLRLSPTLSMTLLGLSGHTSRPLLAIAARFKLLPESYLYGLSGVLAVNASPRIAFLLGRLYPRAFWYYFPVTVLIKSTLGFLALLILALARLRAWSGESYRKAAYLLIPPALFLGVNLTSAINIGIRHILPIYPFLILAAAAGAWELAGRRRAWAVVIAALVGFHVVSSLHAHPNYLAYSNGLWGGTSRTYRLLSDSNVDWGQGLIQAREYLARRNIRDCWFAYYGSADPGYYHIPCKMLPDPFLWWWGEPAAVPPENFPGVVLISATEISGPDWGPAELNPYSHFLASQPAANLGGSILVFEGNVDLRAAAAQAHMTKGWDLYDAGQPEIAMQELLKAEELAPHHPGPPSMLGAILAKAQRTEEARTQLTLALKLAQAAHPEFHSVWLDLIKAQLADLD
jgi:4-amino-4-deoxy-L-arabinose transferase-like glycosyltransferase